MKFFEYNGQIVSLSHVTNFSFPQTDDKNGFVLTTHLDYAQGVWDKDLMPVGAIVELDRFDTKKEALQVARDIIAGNYEVDITQAPVDSEPESEPVAKETATEDPAELNKIIEGTRELYRNAYTDTICAEIGINKNQIYAEAQRLWGKSESWEKPTWKNYLHAIANFHQHKGVLYDSLRPKTDETKNGNQTETKKSPF